MKKHVPALVCTLVALCTLSGGTVSAEDAFGGGEIRFTRPAPGVLFSHRSHVEEMGLECDQCHESLFAMEALSAQQKGDFTMAGLAEGKYCGACHNGNMAFAADAQCSACHVRDGGDVYFTEPVEAVFFSHRYHVEEMGLGCESCHNGLFEMKALKARKSEDFTMAAFYRGEYCGACHDGQTAFASNTRCASCHVGVKGYRKATGAAVEEHQAH